MEERDPMTHGGHGAPGRPAAEAGQTVPGTPGAPQPDGTVPPPGGGAQRRRLGGRVRFWLLTLAAATAGVAAVLVGLALTGPGGGSATAGGPGRTAPVPARNFTVPVLGHPGQHLSLSAYAGKPVIVNFFASWCSPCQRETPLLARFYRASHGRVNIIGIDVNDPASPAMAFVRRMGVRYPVGVDAPPMPTSAAYNVSGLPQTFFLDARHRIIKRVFGAVTRQQLTAGTAMIDNRMK